MRNMLRLLLSLAVLSWATAVFAEDTVVIDFSSRTIPDLRLPVGRSQLINSPVPLEQAVTGAPDVADIKLLSSQRVLILGIKPGRTNLAFRQKGSEQVVLMNVIVGYDRNGIKQKIYESMPGEDRIEVRDSNDRVILTGQASSATAMDMALAVARSFVPPDKVENLLQVGGGQQVMLEARIAEISRNSLKDLGIQSAYGRNTGTLDPTLPVPTFEGASGNTGVAPPNVPFLDYAYLKIDPMQFFAVRLQALEKKGLAKTLAEPNLVAMSGQEANFLAGGEIPIPVAQSSVTAGSAPVITVVYKEFGVGLRFTPTVLDASRINLKMLSEVSAIDSSKTYSTGLINLPAFTTRRAGTTIEMGDGQSFAIAGLIQSDMRNAISQLPLLGSLPVLGALFRSTDFQRDESELVLIVTVHLVKPVRSRDLLQSPTDVFTPPNDVDQYLLGRLEGTPKERKSVPASSSSSVDGGVDGSFGHQVNSENRNAK